MAMSLLSRSLLSRMDRGLAVLLAGTVIALTGQPSPARADRPIDTRRVMHPSPQESEDKASQDQKHWLKKLAGAMMGHETSEYARSHASVLNAFRATVETSAKCTVRIWCGDRQVALGTIIDSDGFVATKASELSDNISCELSDGSRHEARRVGVDPGSDLALLRISAEGLPTIRWSDGDPPSVGGWVITSGLNDVPQAIGIVSVAPHHVRGGVLGVQMTEDEPGPRITYVVPGSGAAVAGLTRGDIITHVGGKRIKRADDMVNTTSNLPPGEKIRLSITRLETTVRITATLGSVASTLSSRRAQFQDHLGSALSKRRVLFPSVLEHDSVLNPNQCGGVLVNLDGEAIGVNIARASRISCYAIPASVARPILESLMARISQRATVPVATQLSESDLTETAID